MRNNGGWNFQAMNKTPKAYWFRLSPDADWVLFQGIPGNKGEFLPVPSPRQCQAWQKAARLLWRWFSWAAAAQGTARDRILDQLRPGVALVQETGAVLEELKQVEEGVSV